MMPEYGPDLPKLAEEPAKGKAEPEVLVKRQSVPDKPTGKGQKSEPDAAGVPENKGKKSRKKKKKTFAQALLQLLIKIVILAVIVWILVTFIGGVFICHTSDMYPALRDGDLAITYRLSALHSGDIVAYRYEDKTYFGRIVGEPGDVINISAEGDYTVNGLRPYEVIFYATNARESDTMTYPYTVRAGEYFVLADAREQGLDSRNFGPVTELMGKVVLMLRRRGF